MPKDEVLRLLAASVALFALFTVVARCLLPKDDMLFGVLAGGVTTSMGSLTTYITRSHRDSKEPHDPVRPEVPRS